MTERLNGEDGLGAIYPAMANSVLMYDAIGYPPDHPDLVDGARIDRTGCSSSASDEAYCQPCVSPVWDTALAAHALLEAGDATSAAGAQRRARLAEAAAGAGREGRLGRPSAGRAPGRLGLPVRQRPLSRSRRHRRRRDGDGPRRSRGMTAAPTRMRRRSRAASEWVEGLQSRDGAWGAFDADNTYSLSQPHPVRRSRRAARSADRRRHRALRLDAGAARRDARDEPRSSRAASTR